MKILNDYKIVILICLTLGLAPYSPEPHIWGKLKWILGDASGMKFLDWFDVLLHGSPFILLIRIIFIKLRNSNKYN
jgi:hypothetical protein